MPNISHSALTGSELHEPKGADNANANEVYVANGAGSGSFQTLTPMGGWRYNAIGTGTTFSAPSSYTLMNVAGTSTVSSGFTNNSLGRLTYTGTPDRHLHAVIDLSFKHSVGGGQDVTFAAYKNGSILTSPNHEMITSADSANYQHVAMHFDDTASTNDYYEIYLKTPIGNVIVHSAYFFLVGMPM